MLDQNVYLHPQLKPYFCSFEPLFEQMMALRGECYRQQKSRRTQRILLGEKYYFIKQHEGTGFKEILKDLVQFRLPILGAKNEKQAIDKLQRLNILVPQVFGYGIQTKSIARQRSFILLEEIAPAISLEDLTKSWTKSPPDPVFKHKIILEVARIARILHQNGINHRDFYLCHFLLDVASGLKNIDKGPIKLYLIDLHRAQIRHLTPRRWIIKDLSGLYFSSKDIGLTQRDVYRFMQAYTKIPLRELLGLEKGGKDNGQGQQRLRLHKTFWHKVRERGERLYSDHTKRK